MKLFACLIVLFVCLAGSVRSDARANQFVDQLVSALNQKSFDPLVLPRYATNVDRYFGLVHLNGELVVHYIKLTGLNKARRVGEVTVEQNRATNSTTFKAQLQMGGSNVKAFSSVSAYVGNHFHPEFRVETDIGDIATHFAVEIDRDGSASLSVFEIDQFKHVRFHLQGPFLPLDPMVELVGDVLVTIFNTQARHLLSTQVQPIVQSELATFKFHPYL